MNERVRAPLIQHPEGSFRGKVLALTESRRFQMWVVVLLVINAFILGLETDRTLPPEIHQLLWDIDHAFLGLFVIEIIMRIYANGLRFFKQGWNLFDFIIIVVSLLPLTGAFNILRGFRVLRVLRLFSMIPKLRSMVTTLVASIPGIISIVIIMSIIFYTFSVIATNLFGGEFPEWFGSIGRSMFSLFQIMTLEDWANGIARPVMVTHPYAWSFFVPFILITTFTMLNLFVAVLVSAMTQNEPRRRAGDAPDLDVRKLRKTQ